VLWDGGLTSMLDSALAARRRFVSSYEYAVYRTVGILNVVRWLEWPAIERWAAIQPQERLLDAACGRGSLTFRLAKRTRAAYGFDISAQAIRRARRVAERAGSSTQFATASAEHLPFKTESFDKIVSSSSLEHFRDGELAIAEMARVLRAGGTLVLTTDNLQSLADELRERHRKASSVSHYYTEDELLASLRQYLDVRRTRYLINSPVSKFFYRIGVRLDWGGTAVKMLVWLPLCLIAYPCSLLADALLGSPWDGYTFMVEAVKKQQGSR
jgi:SAM-dependent methyltransferase